jgi:hypothetical protein
LSLPVPLGLRRKRGPSRQALQWLEPSSRSKLNKWNLFPAAIDGSTLRVCFCAARTGGEILFERMARLLKAHLELIVGEILDS